MLHQPQAQHLPPPFPPQIVYQGPCTSLKRNKTDTDVVGPGLECGIVLGGGEFTDYRPGDTVECVRVVTRSAGGGGAGQ